MKRHKSLAPLSREHHEALILAQLLKKGAPAYKDLPTDKEGKVMYALALFNEKMRSHFITEELMMDKLHIIADETLHEMSLEIRNDHRKISAMFSALSPESTESELDVLGKKLEEHIRKEERVIFPLIEKLATPELMEELHNDLRH